MISLTNKQLLILGMARQGMALARFAVAAGAEVTISDLRPAESLKAEIDQLSDLKIKYVLGGHPDILLDRCDLMAVSGSVPLTAPIVQAAKARGIPLTNDSHEVIKRISTPLTIGITGSAGKTTTTSLVGAIFETAGIRAWVGGNIGRPLITSVPKIEASDTMVQELSSFQLDLWRQSPHVAAVTNITPNHLDRHKTMAAYTAAKANILMHQLSDDIAILNRDDAGSMGLAPLVKGRLRSFSLSGPVEDGAFIDRDRQKIVLRDGEREIPVMAIKNVPLLGQHNLANVLAAITIATTAHHIGPAILLHAISQFQGVPHRLEQVAVQNGVRYINDSIATAPERALAGIDALAGESIILLAGGKDKNMVWEPWATAVSQKAKRIILFGALADLLAEKLAAVGLSTQSDRVIQTKSMADAVDCARQTAQPGDIVLLSPGGTSYDAFKDFEERGKTFREILEGR